MDGPTMSGASLARPFETVAPPCAITVFKRFEHFERARNATPGATYALVGVNLDTGLPQPAPDSFWRGVVAQLRLTPKQVCGVCVGGAEQLPHARRGANLWLGESYARLQPAGQRIGGGEFGFASCCRRKDGPLFARLHPAMGDGALPQCIIFSCHSLM